MNQYPYDFEEDLSDHLKSGKMNIESNDTFWSLLYSTLCNTQWRKKPDDKYQEMYEKIKHCGDLDYWSITWRSAGGLVAKLRNSLYNLNEDYMDWYLSGQEGKIYERIQKLANQLGWEISDYPVDFDEEFKLVYTDEENED